ncbi:unnamed protein product [Thelazia callipaeda]|uniref:Uncharacterized protein n=1 Tax=Thelazia callipaeda TaxID=103827 RepID=A0A0N5CP37_THECL|nr:unnamed protein product [Thelazia callipaeda]
MNSTVSNRENTLYIEDDKGESEGIEEMGETESVTTSEGEQILVGDSKWKMNSVWKRMTTLPTENENETVRKRIDKVTIGLVFGISLLVFLIIIVNCFTLRLYLRETRDDRLFRNAMPEALSDSKSYRHRSGGSCLQKTRQYDDESIWNTNSTSIELGHTI